MVVQRGKLCISHTMKLLASYWLLLLFSATSANRIPSCTKLVHLARAEQSDENGLKCWDIVKVPTCGGRCDSSEIADWEFPFKKTHHPVCMYGNRRALVVRLRHCDNGVIPGTELFHFIAPEDCRCKVCSSHHTSCEWLPTNSTILQVLTDNSEPSEI